ncbi:unannotated protein [freshwater metagenome]|uniref:Unannotated protein n=1 Tax=freshwater metagenome TaxID=449393 RepID=A0A6J6TX18_9ZZZZ
MVGVMEGDEGAQQLRAESGCDKGRIHGVQVGHDRGQVGRLGLHEDPREAVLVAGDLDRRPRIGVEERLHVGLDIGERSSLWRTKCDRAASGRDHVEIDLQGDCRRRQREQCVEIGLNRLAPSED